MKEEIIHKEEASRKKQKEERGKQEGGKTKAESRHTQ